MKNVIFVLMLGLLFGACQSQKKIMARRAAFVSSQQLDTQVEEQPAEKEAAARPAPRTEEPKVRQQEEKVEKTAGADLKGYCIIVGSFVQEQNAVNLTRKLAGQGFRYTSILRNEAGMFRVCASSYDSYERASLEVRGIRKAFDEYRDAWVLIPRK